MTVRPHPETFDRDEVGQKSISQDAVSQDERDLLRFITCGSVDDGKSSLIGRLLHDTKQVFGDQIASLKQQSRRYGTRGTDLDLALLVDGLQAEREQGITIDVAYRFFSTPARSFIVADTPGHEQYTRNMATGASTADAAIILVDARHGLTRQTRRHILLVSMLGVRHVALAVNKMDLVDWSHERFDAIVREFDAFAGALHFVSTRAIPMSAITGDNVVTRGDVPWYHAGTLLDFLENTPVAQTECAASFAMPVQWVNRPHADFRGFAGRLVSGAVQVGDAVVIMPSGQPSRVAQILTPQGDRPRAISGQSITLLLADDVDASRGSVLAAPESPLRVTDRIAARLFWASEAPLAAGETFWVKIGTATVNAVVESIVSRIDPESGAAGSTSTLETNDIGEVILSLDRTIAATLYAENRELGGLILISRDTTDTAALGLVTACH